MKQKYKKITMIWKTYLLQNPVVSPDVTTIICTEDDFEVVFKSIVFNVEISQITIEDFIKNDTKSEELIKNDTKKI